MKPTSIFASFLLVLSHVQVAQSDFNGPSYARHSLSPDGKLLVRITTAKPVDKSKDRPRHEIACYEFDAAKDSYVRRSSFPLTGELSQMLYVSNSGEIIMINLGHEEAIRLYSNKGKLRKSWNVADFLTEAEITACAKTGSTLQWLDEAEFDNRVFYWSGPSRFIRALRGSFTVMRGADPKVEFSGTIDVETAKIKKDEPEEP
jgi:hypothetical protein